jgi:zinc protease
MLRRAFLTALTAAALTAGAAAADDRVNAFTLENGLEVIVVEDHRAPAVTQMLWYRAGSADEPPGSSGVAHYLEHLLFQGTTTRAPGEFGRIVNANGGTDNAATSYDYTMYFQRVAADRLDLIMALEADRMVNLALTPELLETELGVILEERNQRVENEPGSLMREQRMAVQYMHHPYRVPIIGWRHEMETLDEDAVFDFYRTHYAPNNAILIVAGDTTPEEVRALAEEHYGPIPANPAVAPRERVQEPPQLAERRMTFRDPRVAQPYVTRSYLAPERDPGAQETAAALTLLAEVLGGGQTSVLNRKLQFESDVAVYVAAFYSGTSYDDTSFGMVVVPGADVTLEEAEAALDQAVAEFLEEGVDPDQLERIKFQLRASEIYASDSVESVARRYGQALTAGLTVEDVEAWPAILQAVTGEDIVAAARAVFQPRTSVTAYLVGEDAEQEVTQ